VAPAAFAGIPESREVRQLIRERRSASATAWQRVRVPSTRGVTLATECSPAAAGASVYVRVGTVREHVSEYAILASR
jgi:hypothetical protein